MNDIPQIFQMYIFFSSLVWYIYESERVLILNE